MNAPGKTTVGSHRLRLAGRVIGLAWWCFTICHSDAAADPESRWLHGFVLVQTGHQLAERELWPLAMANYAAALNQFEALSVDHPDFQPRLLGYRKADLKERIASAAEAMQPGEHDLEMLYEDVIETAREGASRRYALDFEGSYQFLVRAQWQFEAVLRQCSEGAAQALAKQRAFIEEITSETREDLIRQPDGPLKLHNIEKDFAAAVQIALTDLPSFRPDQIESETETGMSSALFPEALVLQVRGEWYR
ncbi:MAG: hypothetical protein KDL87_05115 [Verrucomicrobiae bacterium]|nr:hypothetical protein [Verrucomicrobiae bacterium]